MSGGYDDRWDGDDWDRWSAEAEAQEDLDCEVEAVDADAWAWGGAPDWWGGD